MPTERGWLVRFNASASDALNDVLYVKLTKIPDDAGVYTFRYTKFINDPGTVRCCMRWFIDNLLTTLAALLRWLADETSALQLRDIKSGENPFRAPRNLL